MMAVVFCRAFSGMCGSEERTRVSDGGGNRGSGREYNNQL
jgi:hypothetical protein